MAYAGPSWKDIDASKRAEDRELIRRIAGRATTFGAHRMSTEMDILCVHTCGPSLDLPRLLAADDFNFAHDIGGIAANLNRAEGRLENHFTPRFRKRAA